jgi:hypothetical protein
MTGYRLERYGIMVCFPAGEREQSLLHCVQTGSGAQWVLRALSLDIYLVPRLRICDPYIHSMSSWHNDELIMHKDNFILCFTFIKPEERGTDGGKKTHPIQT